MTRTIKTDSKAARTPPIKKTISKAKPAKKTNKPTIEDKRLEKLVCPITAPTPTVTRSHWESS